jgi:hypothetical protein
MPIDRLVHLEAEIQETHGLHPRQKEQLLRLLSDPKQEPPDVSNTHEKHAQGTVRCTDISAHEATRRDHL